MPAIALLLLTVLPSYRLTAQSSPQPITVIAAPGFRARPIRQHQASWLVAFDTAHGGVIARRLALGAFTFTGIVRVDGLSPFARSPERPGYRDSVRFDSDGRVTLLVADSGRGPIQAELRGVAGANAARLLVSAAGWPRNRVVVVTIEPLDVAVTAGGAGYGVRDRIRVDDAANVAFTSDSAATPAVIAVAMGEGASGRMQSGLVDIVLERDFGGEVGRERRNVNRLVLFVEPRREDDGAMQAEVVFGLGRTEAEALEAARGGSLAVPAQAVLPRIITPEPDLVLALTQLLGAASWTGAVGLVGPAAAADSAWPADAALWRDLVADARRIITRDYGRPDSLSAETRRFGARLLQGVLGVAAVQDGVAIGPRVAGVADDFTWRVDGFRFGSDSLAYSYRPADRRATIDVTAARRVRLELRFPWLNGESCVMVRRGGAAVERLPMVLMRGGWYYVDVRAGFDPATVTVSAAGCRG